MTKKQKRELAVAIYQAHVFVSVKMSKDFDFSSGFLAGLERAAKITGFTGNELYNIWGAAKAWVVDRPCLQIGCIIGCHACKKAGQEFAKDFVR